MKRIVSAAIALAISSIGLSAGTTPTYPRGEGVNLRILDDNVWDYSKETIPSAWKDLPADPRDSERSRHFARLIGDYLPDIITFQEFSYHMKNALLPKIEGLGYVYAEPEGNLERNDTPIYYNRNAVELVEINYNLYTPKTWSNHNSKSYDSAVFIHKATGRYIGVVTTHLWWKSDKVCPGSTYARASQACLVMAEVQRLQAKYDCPFFVTGDMNAYEDSLPIKLFLQEGFEPCYKIATVFADQHTGHHECGPQTGYSRKEKPAPRNTRQTGAIDHCFLKNANDLVEIKRFDCVMEEYTVAITDHYPNVIDALVK